MKKCNALPLFVFLLLSIFTTSAFATVDVNVSLSTLSNNPANLRCTNSTSDNQIYCFIYDQNNGSPWVSRFLRLNATGGNQSYCTLTDYSYQVIYQNMVLLNQSYLIFTPGNAACDLWNVSNIGSGTCSLVTRYTSAQCNALLQITTASFGFDGTKIYTLAGGAVGYGQVSLSNMTLSGVSNGYWNRTINWNYNGSSYSTYGNVIYTPYVNSNTTIYQSAVSGSKPYPEIYRYDYGEKTAEITSPFIANGICSGTCYSDIIAHNGGLWEFVFDRSLKYFYRLNFSDFENNSISCNWNGEPLGTKCINSQTYAINYDNCNVTNTFCPDNSYCVQITPVVNATSDLIENFTNCMIRTYFGTDVKCSNVCFAGSVVWSNCYDNGCKKCPDSNGLITYGTQTGYFTNTYYSNSGSMSVGGYSISCVDQLSGKEIYSVNQSGNNTTVIDILKQSGNDITEIQTNTTTPEAPTTTQQICSSWGGALALGIASMFGVVDCTSSLAVSSLLIAFIISAVLLVGCAIYIDVSGSTAGILFLGTNLFLLVMFTLAGWFPMWLIVILIVIASLGVGATFLGLVG